MIFNPIPVQPSWTGGYFISNMIGYIINLLLDGLVFLVAIGMHFKVSRQGNGGSPFKTYLKENGGEVFVNIHVHVMMGYLADFTCFLFIEKIVFSSLDAWSWDPAMAYSILWWSYFAFITLLQALALRFTLRKHDLKYKVNVILGCILFGVLTNPVNYIEIHDFLAFVFGNI
jgi:hypothetical protein